MNSRWLKACVATLLIVLALATLLLDCVGLSYAGQALLAGDSFDGLLSQVPSLSVFTSMFSLSGDANLGGTMLADLTRALRSGGLSPLELRGLLSTASGMLKGVASLASLGGTSFTGAAMAFDPSIIDTMSTVSIVLTVAVALALAAGCFAIIGALLNRRGWGVPFAVVLLLLTVGETVLVLVVNSTIPAGELLACTPWPFLGLALALAAMLVCLIRRAGNTIFASRPARAPKPARANRGFANPPSGHRRSGGWACPVCGTPVDGDGRFCPGCGTPKPGPRRCPGCGVEVTEGSAFCTQCGTALSGMNAGYGQDAPFTDIFQHTPTYPPRATPIDEVFPPESALAGGSAESTDTVRLMNRLAEDSGTVRMSSREEKASVLLTIELHQDWQNAHHQSVLKLMESAYFGRMPECDVQIADNTVSGRHMKLEREGDRLFVTDMKSANGTLLNGTALLQRAEVNSGDELTLGRTRLVLHF